MLLVSSPHCFRFSGFLMLILCGILWSPSRITAEEHQSQGVLQWEFQPESHQLRFTSPSAIAPQTFLLENPTRIVIDLPQTTLGIQPVSQNYSGLVTEIRIAQFQPDITRIVLELSPEARLISDSVTLTQTTTSQAHEWELAPKIEKITFPLSTLMQLPPVSGKPIVAQTPIQVPPPPQITPQSSLSHQEDLHLSQGKEIRLRYRGKKPLTLEVEQPWQEILFLEENLTNSQGHLIAPAKTPVIGHFKTTSQGTRFITQALITTLTPVTTSAPYPVIPLSARSPLFPPNASSSPLRNIIIPPNTVFTVHLTEDWHYQR